jgi:predicted ATP-dependent Lon-type protease
MLETNPRFQKFSERLRTIRDQFEQGQLDLSERIKEYKGLLDDVKSAHEEAKASGMELKTFSLYLLTKDFCGDTDDQIVRNYVADLTKILDDQVLDANWQESSKYDLFLKNIKKTILELTLKDYRDKMHITDFSKFQNRITDAIIKTFK